MARQLGDTEYVGSCRFEWSERRHTGELCGWFFLHYPDSEPDVEHRLWIIESPPLPGEFEPSYFVQPGPGENPGSLRWKWRSGTSLGGSTAGTSGEYLKTVATKYREELASRPTRNPRNRVGSDPAA
jgi:hypothetical protein